MALYLAAWPVPIDPQPWQAPADPGFTGVYAENDALKNVERLFADEIRGPDFIFLNAENQLMTALSDGRVVELDPAANEIRPRGLAGGRPLGFVQTGEHRFVLANPHSGLTGTIKRERFLLSTEADGTPFRYTSDVALTARGEIYFTDASSKFGFGETYSDFLEHGANGRLLRFDDLARTTTTVQDGLYFPGGLAVSPAGAAQKDTRSPALAPGAAQDDYLLIAETSAYRVSRYWLTGEKAGTREAFIENLPGLPAHISWNGTDTWWLALYSPRIAAFDRWANKPWLRKLVLRLPGFLQPKPEKRAWILGLDVNGHVSHNLQYAGEDAYAPITSVREHDGWLYLGSLTERGVGRIRVPAGVFKETANRPAGDRWQRMAPALALGAAH